MGIQILGLGQKIPAWISNHIHYKVWDEITCPFPNFITCTLKFGNGWVISSHTLLQACDYLSMQGLKSIQVSKRGPRWQINSMATWPDFGTLSDISMTLHDLYNACPLVFNPINILRSLDISCTSLWYSKKFEENLFTFLESALPQTTVDIVLSGARAFAAKSFFYLQQS